ncbi:MAG: efflux RND transporter periplasmic adaptor subunit [Planctomycetota bacterium]|nr:efflux RND transporter periplasmic adaptor subunit [Planctomycetota bacterium]
MQVSWEQAGRAAQIPVRVGDAVKKGDVLLVLDSPELGDAQSDFLQKRAALASVGPAVDLAKNAYERAKVLHAESEGIALTEVQKREAEFKAAQGAVVAAQGALTAAESRLRLLGLGQERINLLAKTSEIDVRYPIVAPMDGHVLEREVTLGELVRPEREALAVLADLSTLWVLADVSEARLRHVALGAAAKVRVAATGDEPLDGTVAYIAPQLDAATRTATVRIEIKGDRPAIRAGMFAQVEILVASSAAGGVAGVGSAEAVLAVPEEAVQTVEGGPAVFVPVAGEENTFAKRAIKVGRTVGGMTIVLDGLHDGDSYIVAGSFILKAELGKAGAAHEH